MADSILSGKIISDGTGAGTKVFLASGVEVKGITKIDIEMRPGFSIARVEVTLINPALDLNATVIIGNEHG